MIFVISLVFIFLTRLRFPSRLSIAEVLRKRYGDRTLKLIRKFEKTDLKHKKALLDLQYLKICEDHNVIPKFLRFKTANSSLRSSSTYKRCQRKLLLEEIYNKKLVVSKLGKDSRFFYNNIKSEINLIDFHHVLNISLISNEKELEQIKFRHLSKLKNLIPNFSWDLIATSSHDPEKVIFNFSSYKLSPSDKRLLSKGLRFAIPPKQVDYSEYLTEFELLYRSTLDFSMSSEETDRFKTKLKEIALSSYKLFNDNCQYENNLSVEEIRSLKNLMRYETIVIQKADKGNTIVITDKEKYIEGVKNVISDNTKFVRINTPPEKYINYIVNVEKHFKELFKNLWKNDKISKDEYKKICPKGSRPGILYGNPKVHKPVVNNLPKFRPILSAINTPGYNVAKFLIPILEPLTHNEFTVKDSFSFAKEIITYNSSLFMASLDVESLFTNIPLHETIKNCVEDLHNKNLYNGKLNKAELFKLLETATSESSFIFDYLLYKQIDGVAMGSPLGPTLANAFLCHYEKEWLDNCPSHFKPVVYKRYVDDIFVLFSSREHLQLFVDYMNKQHKCIKFTSETECNNSFSFLDIKIARQDNQFKTSVYRKPTFSGVFTHYESYLDNSYKKSLIYTLLSRCFSICSDYTLFHLEVEKLREILKKNSYPVGVIEQSIKTFLNKLYVPKKVYLTAPKKELFIILPYLETMSSSLKRKLRNCFGNSLPQCNIKIIFKSTTRLSSLFRFKDVLPKELRSHLVYKFSCGICNDTYYGKTERHIKVRSGEHLGISALTGKRVACKPSAVSDHLLLHDHKSDFNDFTILCRDNNGFRLAIRESLLISRDSPILNKNVASIPLLLFD